MPNFHNVVLNNAFALTEKDKDVGQVLYYNEDAGIESIVQLSNAAIITTTKINSKTGEKEEQQKQVRSRFSILTKDTGETYLLVSVHLESGAEKAKDIIRHHQRLAIQREIDAILKTNPDLKKVVIYGDFNKSAFKPNPGKPAVAAEFTEDELQEKAEAIKKKIEAAQKKIEAAQKKIEAAVQKLEAAQKKGVKAKAQLALDEAQAELQQAQVEKAELTSISPPFRAAMPAVPGVDSQDPDLSYDDFVVDGATLYQTATDFAGENLVLADYQVSERIMQKVRLFFNFFSNQQTKKGGELDWDSKTAITVFDVNAIPADLTPEAKAAREAYRNAEKNRIISQVKVPSGEISTLGTDKTGVDHGAARATVDGIRIVAQPLIKTSGDTGFMPWSVKYKRALTEQDLENQEQASRKLVYLILKAKNKAQIYNTLKVEIEKGKDVAEKLDLLQSDLSPDNLDSMRDNESDLPSDARFIGYAGYIIDALSENEITALLKKWAATDEYIKAIEPAKKNNLESDDEIAEIVAKVLTANLGDNKRLEVITGALDLQISAGFAPMTTNPRIQQKKTIYAHLQNCDVLGTTEDGPDNHDNYKYDTQKMFRELRQRTSLNMILSFVGGAVVGAAVAVVLGAALPVVAAATAVSGILATSTFYYTRGVSSAEIQDKKVAAAAKKAAVEAEKLAKKAAAAEEKAAKEEAAANKAKAKAKAEEKAPPQTAEEAKREKGKSTPSKEEKAPSDSEKEEGGKKKPRRGKKT